jgi:hypothetical protein
MSQNQPYYKKTSPSYTQQCQHQNKFKKFQNKYYCIPQPELKMHKRESVASASSSKPKRLFQFYNAKHLYYREKQHLTERTCIITPPHDMTHYSKEDLYSRFANLVPSFAARCHLFCGYFFTPEINNRMKQNESTIVYRNYPFTP